MKRSTARRAVLLSLSLMVSTLALPGWAQETQEGNSVFTEVLEVRVVNLEVVVEDKAGHRVTDLKPEDFQLWVDGQALPIDYFTEIRGGEAMAVPQGEASPQALPGVAAGQPMGTSYLVFIDDYFTIAQGRNRSLQGVIDALSFLGPGDQMAVVAFDGQRLDMLTSWSDSRKGLEEILEAAKSRKAWGRRNQKLLQENLPLQLAINAYEEAIQEMAVALRSTLRGFARPEGRKVMMLVAGEWPNSPTLYLSGDPFGEELPEEEGLFSAEESAGPGFRNQDPIREDSLRRSNRVFEPVYQTANRLGYTLYPIDAAGIGADGYNMGDPSVIGGPARRQDPFAAPGGLGTTNTRFDMSNPNPSRPIASLSPEQEIHTTLQLLAFETGGQPLIDSSRINSLERVVADTRSYYWLGFTPEWQGDDEVHDLKVEVLKPGLRVRTRESYQDLSRTREVDYMVESALLFGEMPWSAPLQVEIGEASRRKGRRVLPLQVQVPLDQVTVLPQGGAYVAEVELRIMALDKAGHTSDVDVIPFEIRGGAAPKPGQRMVQSVEVEMRKGTEGLLVALHDPLSGNVFTARLAVPR